MYKDFVNVTPKSGGAGTTPIAVAADEKIEVKYWLDAATSGTGKSIYLEAYANNDVASNLKINFSIDQQGPTGE